MDLELPVRTRGRATVPDVIIPVGPVTEADLALLSTERGSKPPGIRELRDRHHSIARLLAAGHKPFEVSAITGYALSTISIMQGDPTFQELLSFYRNAETAAHADLMEINKNVAVEAATEVRNRLAEGDMDDKVLVKVYEKSMDRAGAGPQSSKTLNVNVGLADRLESVRQRLRDLSARPMVDVTPAEEPVA